MSAPGGRQPAELAESAGWVNTALAVRGLAVDYRTPAGPVQALRDVGFGLRRGHICGVAGESGSGKSTAALAAMGWESAVQRRTAGVSELDGLDLFALSPKALRDVWGRRVGYVPQEIGGALHPSFRIGSQFRETLKINCAMSQRAADARAVELLAAAGIPDPAGALRRYAHEFSGGQLQRIAIALALVTHPEVLILDEPTTGLDVTTQRVVVKVLRRLVADQQVAALFISHDLALLAELADDVVIMYAGEIVESGPAGTVVGSPRHPYTRALLDAVPTADRATMPRGIPGLPPGRVVRGSCAFEPRCQHRTATCATTEPTPQRHDGGHIARCLRSAELQLTATALALRAAGVDGAAGTPLLEVTGLRHSYRSGQQRVPALVDVSFTVDAGDVLALVGESGSGKSTVGRVVAGALRPDTGQLRFDGRALPTVPRERTAVDRRAIQLIFQNPSGSLSPRRSVGDQLDHIARRFVEGSAPQRAQIVAETLDAVQLAAELLDRYPHQLSGGQRQRVAIAGAFIARPRLVICDEITSGQDVSVQAAVLGTLAELQRAFGTAVVLISHDLGVVRAVADHVCVLRAGHIVEQGRTEAVFAAPADPYTQQLLAAVPRVPGAEPSPLEGSARQ